MNYCRGRILTRTSLGFLEEMAAMILAATMSFSQDLARSR